MTLFPAKALDLVVGHRPVYCRIAGKTERRGGVEHVTLAGAWIRAAPDVGVEPDLLTGIRTVCQFGLQDVGEFPLVQIAQPLEKPDRRRPERHFVRTVRLILCQLFHSPRGPPSPG